MAYSPANDGTSIDSATGTRRKSRVTIMTRAAHPIATGFSGMKTAAVEPTSISIKTPKSVQDRVENLLLDPTSGG
ncbi:hypothetical protein [Rhodococcus rhodochrous]|uniref:hypothetical protein n=2 Tax=Nocardiaceae TaxID=85025 RepID=UPI001D01AD5B|nr:hypothetical protein [Rhodococcus rhodochrous]